MDFKTAMDRLCLTAGEVSDELRRAGIQVTPQTVRQFRLDPGKNGHRTPPAGWKAVFAYLARERGRELLRTADELEGQAGMPFKVTLSPGSPSRRGTEDLS